MIAIEQSFSTSVRQLFRHLDEPHKLRANRLARRFLIDSQTGRFSPTSERRGAGRLRRLVIEGAQAARRADLETGLEERGQRHFVIATRCLIERVHPASVARELGISERQCYRDRAVICDRLARYISAARTEEPVQAVHVFDRLDLRFEGSAQLADLGCEDEAARRYAEIAHTHEPSTTKLRAFALLGEVLLAAGKPDHARAAIDKARAVLQAGRQDMLEDEVQTGACRIALANAKVTWDSGNFRRATAASREAVSRSEMLLVHSAAPDVALCADAFITHALFNQKYGHISEARNMLSKARALAPRLGGIRLELETTLMSANLDASFRVGNHETGAQLRMDQLRGVRAAALTARLFKIAVQATLAISSEYGMHRDSAAVVEHAREAVAMSHEVGGGRFVSAITVGALDAISVTGEVRLASELLLSPCECVPGSFEWILLKMFQSREDTRLRRYAAARSAAQEAERGALRGENWRLHAAVQRQLAEIAHKTGRLGEARAYIERALDGTARHGSASSRLMTLEAAAKITGDAALKREACDLRSTMCA